ncbi:YhbY family RNA-binding protein [Bordetella sp. BOR01]|uniref:YhbY family RNA-binding protein n=1 Tax=Bordetella sp. BOR01 TaxID=2854779 RepID=UPI001C43EEC0|nr:YhbY family RNA-binding protein [Bordetella sp. BOR01]MBV7486348.1 YhbY family RNA-binding protein [Bordetella sp. BOR01]
MPILELTSRERSELRSAAHPLRPVVLIGDNGLTDAVLKEIDRALASHGLIKVRAGGNDRDEREAMLATICDTLSCAPVHHLGKMLILFRPLPGNAAPVAPADGTRPRRKPSEPHTPKKLAAEGKTLAKPRPAPARKMAADPVDPYARGTLNKAGRPLRPGTKKAAAAPHGIPRRAGSALSLRAGARSGVQRTAATSRRAAKATKK